MWVPMVENQRAKIASADWDSRMKPSFQVGITRQNRHLRTLLFAARSPELAATAFVGVALVSTVVKTTSTKSSY